ncbi:ATP-binding cassette domain-containing protein [Actinoalloteichus hymeniacidonis]|uniref:UvrABC system protein A n=1 Tax=Actinoalloteichus hymeniacidonis TaxID=340345 RepID=A0AAC9MZQ3_9PSEU|nr:excinuclease ABC subunit UvrA [Actinoalloteichus hymeniacidonis]AOS64201.1 Excinuclease ATPase subunit [Actinoalloteichus hymeniacidonis]MBB5907731.1 excinuclease UvrABC ATPase subunit [Actinoalloteichus hymeniacidonis]
MSPTQHNGHRDHAGYLDHIEITGARENNLKNISLRIPKRQLTVVTGVSGSGKSSLVFDTIAAEAQRQLNETFTTFVRNRLPRHGRPEVDTVDNLSAAIVVDQKRIVGNSRSTVGTITDTYALLRLLFSRVGMPYVGSSNAFSFNDPAGMCPECEGLGRKVTLDLAVFLDRTRSLNDGALLHPNFAVGGWYWKLYANSGLFDNDKALIDYTESEWQTLLYGTDAKVALEWAGGEIDSRYEGLVERFTRVYLKKDPGEMSDRNRAILERFVTPATCPTCHGARLNPAALGCTIDGRNIAELADLEVVDLIGVIAATSTVNAEPVVASLLERLGDLIDIGLGYLSLNRETSTLSGGEAQRIKTVRHLGSSLTEMIYIFDEPSIGLHPRDVIRLTGLLRRLRDKGNTVLVVEHDRDVIEIADHVVDIGPGAGADGGEVVYSGEVSGLAGAPTPTGTHLRRRMPIKAVFRTPTHSMPIEHATRHNLDDVGVDLPAGVFTVVTGVAGSGKSTLINEVFLAAHPDAIVIDQAAVGVSLRSTPATYTGMMDEIRKLFAKVNGVRPALFSGNSAGACPECQGLGIIYTDLAFMDGLKSTCERCAGSRFRPEVLEHRVRGRSIADVLRMRAAEAAEFFVEKRIQQIVQAMIDVGLDYLTLGQPMSTLSGGECQRIKLATELHKSGTVYVMDEPTTGLHMADVAHLLGIIDRLVDRGNSVIVIEHDLDVVKNADWVVDLGPEGGSAGGRVLFEGTPADLLGTAGSHTAAFLRQDLGLPPMTI